MKIYPVVHMRSERQAFELTEQAFEAGADGVFLIDHLTSDPDVLTNAYGRIRRAVGHEAFVGVNYLSMPAASAAEWVISKVRHDLPDALWTDDAARGQGGREVRRLKDRAMVPAGKLRYFGGIAFKYTPTYTDHPQEAAELAARYRHLVDVVTTSGPGTGQAADEAKIAAIKAAIGGQELALASGVDVDNVAGYKPYVDAALVASSVETAAYSGVYDLVKLRELVQAAHE